MRGFDLVLDLWGTLRDSLRGSALFEISNTGVVTIWLGTASDSAFASGWPLLAFAVLGSAALAISVAAGARSVFGHSSPRLIWRRTAMIARAAFLGVFGVVQLLVSTSIASVGVGLIAVWLAFCCLAGEAGQTIEADERTGGHE